jgi:hypothetical protein
MTEDLRGRSAIVSARRKAHPTAGSAVVHSQSRSVRVLDLVFVGVRSSGSG